MEESPMVDNIKQAVIETMHMMKSCSVLNRNTIALFRENYLIDWFN
ncbi:hypothetical protein [Limosilactobacillus vaginalis]